MATRFYWGVEPINAIVDKDGHAKMSHADLMYQSAFGDPRSTSQLNWRLTTTKADADPRNLWAFRFNQQPNKDFWIGRWWSPQLDAQTVAGTFDLCVMTFNKWVTSGASQSVSVRYKLHIYISVGQTGAVRHTLLSNHVDGTDLPQHLIEAGLEFRTLDAPVALTSGAAQAGDCIVVEVAVRIVSTKTHTPTYPPVEMCVTDWYYTGATAAHADAVDGETDIDKTAWCEFSQTLAFQALPAAPANGTCATAIAIADLPYKSAAIDTSEATGTDREVWFTFTTPAAEDLPGGVDESGFSNVPFIINTIGSNYRTAIGFFFGSCAGLTQMFPSVFTDFSTRSHTHFFWYPAPNITYFVRVRAQSSSLSGKTGGGVLFFEWVWRQAIQSGDVLLASGPLIQAYRDGQLVTMRTVSGIAALSGIGVDYTKREMVSLETGEPHEADRLLVATHDSNLTEILDLSTLSFTYPSESEVDFIADAWPGTASPKWHPAQIVVTSDGTLYQAAFGDGYLYVAGNGTLPAVYNAVSSLAQYSNLRRIDATHGDSQPDAPWAEAVQITLPLEGGTGAAWAIAIDEAQGVLYYHSAGLYVPLGGMTIKRWNLNTASAMADFVTVTLSGSESNDWNDDIKGFALLPLGGLVVAVGRVVKRYDASGNLVQTYTPDAAYDANQLWAVGLSADGETLFAQDGDTTRVFAFNLQTGVQTSTFDPGMVTGTLVQMAVYRHECECCVATELNTINEALLKIGVSKLITATNEASKEAFTGHQLYDRVVRETLRQFPWAFATKYAKAEDEIDGYMNLVAGSPTAPVNSDWIYAYRYPIDCLKARRIVNPAIGRKYDRNAIPFRVGKTHTGNPDNDVLLVFCNIPDAILEYTAHVGCAENFADDLFKDAVAWRLASKMAPSMSRVENMAEKAWAMYLHTLDTAAAGSAGEAQHEEPGEADWILER